MKQEPGEVFQTAYEHTNSRGQKYYLHHKGKLFFFSKKQDECIDLPPGFEVVENQRTGLPMLKRKQVSA